MCFLGNLLFFAYFFALCRLPGALFWSKIVLWSLQNPITFLQTLLATAWPVVCFLRVFVGGGGGGDIPPIRCYPGGFFFYSGAFVSGRMLNQGHLFFGSLFWIDFVSDLPMCIFLNTMRCGIGGGEGRVRYILPPGKNK